MAEKKGRRSSRNSKKEKGAFRKNRVAKTEYQRERDAMKSRKARNGNYSVETL